MNLAPTSSTTAALAMGDALAMALLDLRGVRAEDYAALHPRGSLGWKALGKVRDLMRTGEAVPVVRESASMKEAIEEMSAKSLGMTTVVDGAGRLVGVITDGDLRRHQLAHGDLLDRRASECMTANPKRIGANELAARALAPHGRGGDQPRHRGRDGPPGRRDSHPRHPARQDHLTDGQ